MIVHIVGKGTGWEKAPQEGNVWGITQLNCRRPVTRVIDMNDYSMWGALEAQEAGMSRRIAQEAGVEYIDRATYPIFEVMEKHGVDYFSNTVDYAIALALYEGYTDIHLWGINMISGSEYQYEKPGVDFWCGMALGSGAKLTIHGAASTIMQTKDNMLYGYGTQQNIRTLQEACGGMRRGV